MSPYLRKVKTASGATAVQIVEKKHGQRTILEHVGSARDETELAALLQAGRDKLHANQPMLDLAAGPRSAAVALVEGSRSQLLIDVVRGSWERLGFDPIADRAFFRLVLARLVEPTSKLDSLRVLAELGGAGAFQRRGEQVQRPGDQDGAVPGGAVLLDPGQRARPHRAHQRIRMSRANALVDVQAIRRAANGDHMRSQFMEHLGSNLIGRTMRRIDHDLQTAQ